MFLFRAVTLILLLHCSLAKNNNSKQSFNNLCILHLAYSELPPLYTLQDYDDCIANQQSKYCLLYAEVQPNPDSKIWRRIQRISHDTNYRFRHDILFFGVCEAQCREIIQGSEYIYVFDNPNNFTNEIVEYYESIHIEDKNDRTFYTSFLANCVNKEFKEKYNLTLRTFIEYCDDKSDPSQNDDKQRKAFLMMIFIVIALNTCSSVYDFVLKRRQNCSPGVSFYTKELNSTGQSILTSFSVCRNYNRLLKPTLNENDLQFTYAFRVFTMFVVILGHTLMVLTSIPVQNTEFIEAHFKRPDSMIFQNGSALIQIFFVLSGFWLKYNFGKIRMLSVNSSKVMPLIVYVVCFLDRYLRLLPSLVVLIFFNATYLMHAADGPLWRHMSEGERVHCSKYWWKNVFMINNFLMKDSCAHHTWYLAADTQLYEIYLTIVIVTTMKPWTRPIIYIGIVILAFMIPGFITFFYGLEAFPYLKPESYRYLYFKDVDTFYYTYPQFYCNLGGYLIGFLCAEIYVKHIRGDCSLSKKYRKNLKVQIPLFTIILLFGFGLLFSGLVVMKQNGSNEPTVWIALYAACYRNAWALLGGLTFICMLLKFGWIAYEISCLPVFRVLGRLTFQMYIWHTTILRILFGFYRQPVYLNDFNVLCQTVLAFILTMILAAIIAILVDFPLSHLLNGLLKKAKNKVQC